MAPPLNRTAIIFNLAAFVGFSAFCISTQAPLIQQDILKRCQDALLMHHMPIRGLAVDGRDVVLSGAPESVITSAHARWAVGEVPGVRTVKTRFLSVKQDEPSGASLDNAQTASESNPVLEPATSAQQQEVQNKIDGVLEKQGIAFKTGTAVLTPESELALDKIQAYLTEAPNLFCEIRGYDSHPREARENWVLALQRALATEDYLTGKGIADWRLSTRAFQIGEGTEGRRTDRAVDLVVKAR